MSIKKLTISLLLILTLLIPLSGLAEVVAQDEEVRRYRTLEERRDAGIKHPLTDWLEVSPLIELEYNKQRYITNDSSVSDTTTSETANTFQLEIVIDPAEWVNLEIVYEYDHILEEVLLDEAVAEFEREGFKLELGRLTVPFGEYYSRFVTGPLLEFAETDARALVLAWEPDDEFEAAVFVLKSKVDKEGDKDNALDWGLSLNASLTETIDVGISYLSDISESDDKLLEDNVFYEQKVDGVSAYINVEIGDFDVSAELVAALENFAEFETNANRPRAWNIEFGIYPEGEFEWAFRIEGSDELEDEAQLQIGLGSTWHLHKQVYATAEYLRGRYKTGFVEDDEGEPLNHQKQFALQLVVSF